MIIVNSVTASNLSTFLMRQRHSKIIQVTSILSMAARKHHNITCDDNLTQVRVIVKLLRNVQIYEY